MLIYSRFSFHAIWVIFSLNNIFLHRVYGLVEYFEIKYCIILNTQSQNFQFPPWKSALESYLISVLVNSCDIMQTRWHRKHTVNGKLALLSRKNVSMSPTSYDIKICLTVVCRDRVLLCWYNWTPAIQENSHSWIFFLNRPIFQFKNSIS